jgi:hypothetical protein
LIYEIAETFIITIPTTITTKTTITATATTKRPSKNFHTEKKYLKRFFSPKKFQILFSVEEFGEDPPLNVKM